MEKLTVPLADFLPYQGNHYISPAKAGHLADQMEVLKKKGQLARQAFTELAQAFEKYVPGFTCQRISQWMNQAQYLRPHFWVYFIEEGRQIQEPALALRVLADSPTLGISIEVSMIERTKAEETLALQNKVLQIPCDDRLYYFAQENGVSRRVAMTEDNRQKLIEQVKSGEVRKVQVKYDILALENFSSLEELIIDLLKGWELLMPYYGATGRTTD